MQSKRMILRLATLTAAVALFAAPMANANGKGDSAVIQVEFHDDDMGYNVTSSKGLSNLIHVYCDGSNEKIEFDGDELHNYTHNDTKVIVGVYVKSGSNHAEQEDAPPGAGTWFPNEGVECDEIPVFPSVFAGLAAVALGGLGYIFLRRK